MKPQDSEDRGSGNNKTIEIVVNGTPKQVEKGELSFDELVALAFDPVPTGENMVFTITYRKGGNENRPEGTLAPVETVKVKKGTVFNVTATDKS